MDPLSGLTFRPDLLAAGLTDRELRRLRRGGALAVVRPGAYVVAPDDRLADASTRHALLVRAECDRLGPEAVVSHVSAAVLHRLPVWRLPLDRVHVTRDRRTGARRGTCVHVHAAALDGDEIVEIAGLAVTSVGRTVADLARTVRFEEAVVVADAALHAGSVGPAALVAAVERAPHRPGNPAARRVVAVADGRSESVGETRSRLALLGAGLPGPVLQHVITSATGRHVGRVDFWWPRHRTVGEFDGRVKYGRLLRPGQEPGDVVFEEKRREDLLRADGLRVVRWVWDELDRFELVVPRLRRAFESQPRAN
jgi:hypothetical protein